MQPKTFRLLAACESCPPIPLEGCPGRLCRGSGGPGQLAVQVGNGLGGAADL